MATLASRHYFGIYCHWFLALQFDFVGNVGFGNYTKFENTFSLILLATLALATTQKFENVVTKSAYLAR